MNNRPIGYESLKTIIQHFEPNFRFRLADRIPAIQTAEKCTPLHISNLQLDSANVTIGKTEYSLRCTLENPCFMEPEFDETLEEPCKNGAKFDLNRFGFRNWFAEDVINPGDYRIEDIFEKEERELEKIMKRVHLHYEKIERGRHEPPISYLHLTIKSPDGNIYTEHLSHDRTMPEAMKYLTTKLLGGRKHVLTVIDLYFPQSGILRLPNTMKLKVQHIFLSHNCAAIFNAIQPMIHDDSFPLKNIILEDGVAFAEAENYNHPWIQSADYIQVVCLPDEANWLDAILGLKVLVYYFDCGIPTADLVTLIDTLLLSGRKIGTDFSFGIEKIDDVTEFLNGCIERPGTLVERIPMYGCTEFPEIIIVPLNESSEICIFCEEEQNVDYFSKWELSIIVTPKQHRLFWNIHFDDFYLD